MAAMACDGVLDLLKVIQGHQHREEEIQTRHSASSTLPALIFVNELSREIKFISS